MPTLDRIVVYPIKSLDGLAMEWAAVLQSGALQHDREFALFDEEGRWINGKRDPRVHTIRSEYNLANSTVRLKSNSEALPQVFHLLANQQQLAEWFSDFFGFRVSIQRNLETGFPDDEESPGPTVISSATVRTVGSWFNIAEDEARRRFRANLEVSADEPFWEDRLFGAAGEIVRFRIGEVMLHGINPCQRCAVPSRDPQTGVPVENFQRIFIDHRQATLPSWANASRFGHFYRLSVNTRLPASEAGKVLRVGDSVIV